MWQNQTLQTVADLKFVRFEPLSKLVTSKDDRQITLSAVMFFDIKNSRPKNVTFYQGQKIEFNNVEYTVETIETLYDNQKLHHYELGLI